MLALKKARSNLSLQTKYNICAMFPKKKEVEMNTRIFCNRTSAFNIYLYFPLYFQQNLDLIHCQIEYATFFNRHEVSQINF